MSSPRDDRLYSSIGKSRRGTPVPDSQNSLFLQGQGGRTVLPPLSTAFPDSHSSGPPTYTTPYNQPRSSPTRYDFNPAIYHQWHPGASHTVSSSYNYYEPNDNRYTAQPNYTTYQSRTSPLSEHDSGSDYRKLPPLNTSPVGGYGRDDRYPEYDSSPHVPSNPHIRSTVTSFPTSYAPYAGTHYTYGVSGHPPMTPMNPQSHLVHHTADVRSGSPYPRTSVQAPPASYSPPPPISPTTSEEPAAKKKRRRADAHQLKVLTEVYNRTAFPSTEERQELARQLDMTPRSVQIWFQNRRQSMRQTRQSSGSAHRTQPLGASSMSKHDDESEHDIPLQGSFADPEDHSPTLTSAHRKSRSNERSSNESRRQWARAY